VQEGQIQGIGTRQHSQRDVDHLQILGAGGRGDFAGTRANVIDDGVLEPGDAHVQALGVNVALDAAKTAEDDGAVTTLNC